MKTKQGVNYYLIPTNDLSLSLVIAQADHYVTSTTDSLDLYSYISYSMGESREENIQTPAVILPNLKKHENVVSELRLFDGF